MGMVTVYFMKNNEHNENNTVSALICASRLLQISGITAPDDAAFDVEYNESSSSQVSRHQLQQQLNQFAKPFAARLRLRRLSLNKLRAEHLPMAFRTPEGNFILLARINAQQALLQYSDSEIPQVIDHAELATLWSGLCLFCQQSRFNIRWFIPAFLRHRNALIQVLALSLLLQLLALIAPLFFQVVMDKVLVHHAMITLDVLVITLVVVGVFEVVIKSLREYLLSHTTTRVDIQLGGKLFEHLLRLPLGYFKQRHIGNIVARVRELDSIREFLSSSALTLCVDVVFTLVLFGVMWLIYSSLTLLTLAVVPFYLLLAVATTKPLQRRVEQLCQFAAHNSSFLTETVSGVETVKSLALEPRMQHRWEQQTRDFAQANFRVQNLQSFSSQAALLLQKTCGVLIIWVGASMVIDLQLSIGQLIAFNMLAVQAMQPMNKLVDLWQQGVRARVALVMLSDILSLPVEPDSESISQSEPLIGAITLQQVVFRYRPDLPPTLKQFNLDIKAGEHIGLVGPSGSGKSTVARILQHLYNVESGTLLIDGQPLASFSPSFLRRQVGVVMQENYLFNCSVRENIAHSCPTAPLEQVVQASRLAGADDFILALPLGYDTILAEGGASLSGGQRQRIAIARALLANPRILIFDEATSALDDDSQARVQNNMAQIVASRTVITIAHRLSTVRHCDRIAVMAEGEVRECAPHDELLKHNGLYSRLWRQQSEFDIEESR